jgi:Spy/CpxP family protein refolding chaperone
MGPEIRDEMRRAREEIRKVLTAEQQQQFDEINKKRESRFRRPENPSPGPDPAAATSNSRPAI